MTDTTSTTDGGSSTHISIDQAVESLVSTPEVNKDHEEHAENAAPEQHSEGDLPEDLQIDDSDAADEPSEPDVEDGGDDEDVQEDDESELEPLEAPQFWEADGKERFKDLPREAQELILAEDRKARSAVSKHIEMAATTRKQAEATAKAMTERAQSMEQLMQNAAPLFQSRWSNVDWAAYQRQNPQEAAAAYQQFQSEQNALKAILAEKEQAEKIALVEFHRQEGEALQSMADKDPVVRKLIDPNRGGELKKQVADYLVGNGIDADRLQYVSATEMALAAKAMLYDKAIAKQQSKPTAQKQAATQSSAKMRPASTPSQPQQQKSITSQKQRLAQTGKVDDAVALLLMQNQPKRRK